MEQLSDGFSAGLYVFFLCDRFEFFLVHPTLDFSDDSCLEGTLVVRKHAFVNHNAESLARECC